MRVRTAGVRSLVLELPASTDGTFSRADVRDDHTATTERRDVSIQRSQTSTFRRGKQRYETLFCFCRGSRRASLEEFTSQESSVCFLNLAASRSPSGESHLEAFDTCCEQQNLMKTPQLVCNISYRVPSRTLPSAHFRTFGSIFL